MNPFTASPDLRRAPRLLLCAAVLLAGAPAMAHQNPVDKASNPAELDYRDVDARRPDFKEPFLRDGMVREARGFQQIQAGLSRAQVVELMGQPLREGSGPRGQEWDYNVKLLMPQSANYLVCQYKIVFDQAAEQTVRETVWRRRQCQDLAGTQPPAQPR